MVFFDADFPSWAGVQFGRADPVDLAPLTFRECPVFTAKKAVATDPKAIGYIDKTQVDATVKVLMTLN